MILCTLAIIISLLYTLLIVSFLRGWLSIKPYRATNKISFLRISVIVPFRNEVKNLKNLIDSLIIQSYPKKFYEIILVNDHSEDNPDALVKQYLTAFNNIRILNLPDSHSGKKSALIYGIKHSSGDYIMTTDADCAIPFKWIETFVSYYYEKNNPLIVFGPVDLNINSSLFERIQNLEFLSLIGSGIGAAGTGKAIYCNGANLFFKKYMYQSLNNPLNVSAISGDDTFLLHAIKKYNPKKIGTLKSKDALVMTRALSDFHDFMQQRIRWASKSRYYRDRHILYSSIIVFLMNLIVILSIILFLLKNNKLFFIPVILKTITDLVFLYSVLDYFNKKNLLWYYPFLIILYPFYIAFTAIYSTICSFEWKGRKYPNHIHFKT